MQPIIDVCCGSRMFWFDKQKPEAIFMDKRDFSASLCDGRTLTVKPDVKADFRHIPYADNSFYLAVFDPPHLVRAGKKSWLAAKYGKLGPNWRADLKASLNGNAVVGYEVKASRADFLKDLKNTEKTKALTMFCKPILLCCTGRTDSDRGLAALGWVEGIKI